LRVGIVSYYVRGTAYEPKSDAHARRLDESRAVVERLIDFLDDRGVDVVVNLETAEVLGVDGVPVTEMEDTADVVLAVGGDGTVLRTFTHMDDPVPVLCINTGRVGFLAGATPQNALDKVAEVLDGYDVEHRARISVEVNGEPLPPALNETVVVTSRPAKIMGFDVYHDDELVESVRADGLVVATPTGSTAYSMSAGGPLVDPNVESRLVVPLAPFRMSVAPWVLGSDAETRLVPTLVEKSATVVVDGDEHAEVGRGDEISFRRAENDALFVDTGDTFFEKIRNKLS
jgi:NAD+ kinase